MRYRVLGRTGLRVSELSLGAARGARSSPQEFVAVVSACLEAGINLVDTAAGYDGGESERTLGRALEGRGDVLVETKYCPYESYLPAAAYVGSPAALVASAEESLRRLRRDHVDVFLGHGIRSLSTLGRFMADGCYEAMLKLKEQGKARFIGLSELSEADGTHEVLREAVPSGAFDVVMLTLNFLLQTAAESLLPLCAERGVGTVVMMPMNQASRQSGLVSVPAALECIRRHVRQGSLPAGAPYDDPSLLDFLAPYPLPEAALRYVLLHDVSSCCVGMSSPGRLRDNLKAVDPPYLDPARLRRLRELFGRIRVQQR